MEKINAVITGIGGYVPEYVLNNDELSRMVDTNDEWIMTRIGVKERRILNEEGLGTSYMARKAAKQLLQKTGVNPEDIDCVIVSTSIQTVRLVRFLEMEPLPYWLSLLRKTWVGRTPICVRMAKGCRSCA